MLTDLKPNHQANSLYTGKEISKKSDLQIEPLYDRQLLKENALEDSYTLDFDYLTDFDGNKVLIEEAKAVSKSFGSFLRRTFKDLTRLGTELWGLYNKCVDSLGKTEGKKKFNRWLDAEFGNSQNLARTAMSLSQWLNTLSPGMQRLVAKNVKKWSVAALKKLTSLTDELVAVLVKSGKQTVKSIERAIATSLASELAALPAEEGTRPVTPSDWSSLRKKFNLRPKHIKILKQKAESLASPSKPTAETAPVIKVCHVNEAIAQCKEDPKLLNQPPAKKAKKNKSDTYAPANISESNTTSLQDNGPETLTEVVSSAITANLEKSQAADSELIALLRQALAEKEATITAQEEKMTRAIAGELRKAKIAHQSEIESLHQSLAIKSAVGSVEGMFTKEEMEAAIALELNKVKDYIYTEEDLRGEVADAYSKLKTQMYTPEQLEEELELQEEILKDKMSHMYTKEQVETIVAEAIASMQETAYTEKLASLQQALTEKDKTIASLEKQKAAAVAEAMASSEKQKTTAVAQARADEREKIAIAHQKEVESLRQALAEKEKTIASDEEMFTPSQVDAAVQKARADEQSKTEAAIALVKTLQQENEALRSQNQEIVTARERLLAVTSQVEELKSQLASSKNEYLEKTKLLEGDFNSVVKSNRANLETIKILEEAQESMYHENRSLKEQLTGYKKIETRIQSNYAKIQKTERLQKQNQVLSENLECTKIEVISLSSEVTKLKEELNEINCQQRILTDLGVPGFQEQGKNYVSPVDGEIYQGVKGLVKFLEEIVNNNFNLATGYQLKPGQ